MSKQLTVNGKTIRVDVYRTLGEAVEALKHYCKTHWIMMGDCGEFWAVRPVDAARLEAAGYEFAN
jgi:hypothetical protein